MRTGKYSYKELFVNRYVSRLVIPEIQRDYVWGEGQLNGFLNSILDSYKQYLAAPPPIVTAGESSKDQEVQEDFHDFYRKRHFSANIGFIYAYSDEQYQGRYFLIDGQQRITTIYILLLLLAARNDLKEDFLKNYAREGIPVLDYRVRDSSSRFIKELVGHLLRDVSLDIADQAWYLMDYKHDKTICSLLDNMSYIQSWLGDNELNENSFYKYVQNQTEFWYFDTNISAQGENLYIYLNARGEQMQGNENLKADLLAKLGSMSDKNKWGRLWEDWQDIFWRNRGRLVKSTTVNPNADKGFNSFLYCVAALEQYASGDKSHLVTKTKEIGKMPVGTLSSILTLEKIQSYVQVLVYLDEHKASFVEVYAYTKWIDVCINELWSIFNQDNTDWFIDYSNPQDFSTQTNRMVFVWGILLWVKRALEEQQKTETIFRAIRQFYLRYGNNIRAAAAIKKSVDNLLVTGFISDEGNDGEEALKEHWLARFREAAERRVLESMIWEIEDHPLNIDGSDVGAINISHLVDFNDSLNKEHLDEVKRIFFSCFPGKGYNRELQSLLLFYGAYWRRTKPRSYETYDFSDWKYTIRGVSESSSSGNHHAFRSCMEDLILNSCTVKELLEEKRDKYVPNVKAKGLREQLLWYSYHLREKMWLHGNKIAICNSYGYMNHDPIFANRLTFHNLRTDFRSSDYNVLSKALPNDVKESALKELESG
ncbi:MAG: DUF262 domain-containing protein [Candidatus Pacearchaeota archaeon]|nr:DUF262 domain-containing protein [Candidatus Pacearchaeota archaeon]